MILTLQLAASRLCAALMLGLLAVSGFVAAPVLFAHAGDHQLAGMLAGQIFHLSNLGLLLLAIANAAFWQRLRASGIAIHRSHWLLLTIIALLIATNEWGVAPQMAAIKATAPLGVDALAINDPLRHRFGMLHGISELLHLTAVLASAWLVAIGVERKPWPSEQPA
ncbi:MAG: DUF4149 domain-containing protein [Mariprofundales bacterium]